MFLELIGNDVCKKSFDSMTKPEDFKRNVLKLLDYIDKKVQINILRFLLVVIW